MISLLWCSSRFSIGIVDICFRLFHGRGNGRMDRDVSVS